MSPETKALLEEYCTHFSKPATNRIITCELEYRYFRMLVRRLIPMGYRYAGISYVPLSKTLTEDSDQIAKVWFRPEN